MSTYSLQVASNENSSMLTYDSMQLKIQRDMNCDEYGMRRCPQVDIL